MKFYTNVQMIGNEFYVKGVENGKRVEYKKFYNPKLYIKSNKKSKFKTLEGEYLEEIQPGTVKECREFIKRYEDVDNFNIYGNERFLYQFISDEYEHEIEYNLKDIKIYSIDIEVASENGFPRPDECNEQILLITIQDFHTKNIYTWGLHPYSCTLDDELMNKYIESEIKYVQCKDEKHLLESFLEFWMRDYPDILTGWNIKFYDIPYICGRMEKILGEFKSLSPWEYVYEMEEFIYNRHQKYYIIQGVSSLDYLELYKKFVLSPRESYSLNYICEVDLGQTKLDHSEFLNFKDFYVNGWNKFVDYNIIDTVLVSKLEEKQRLIELAINMAYDAKVNYNDVLFQVRTWDMIIYNYLKQYNIIIPPKPHVDKKDKFVGAYVKEPVPGVYDWVVNFDLNSLYPHLIMQFNISPETLQKQRLDNLISISKCVNKSFDTSPYIGNSVCPNGSIYTNSFRGFLPKLMEKKYNERVIYKKKMIEAKKRYKETGDKKYLDDVSRYHLAQNSRKTSLNSAYGAIGNPWFRYYKLENASAITTSGQVAIKWIEKKLNEYLNKLLDTTDTDYVIAVDTDSVYLNMGDFVKKIVPENTPTNKIVNFLDKIAETKLKPFIDNSYQELATYLNAYEQKMEMKRENIANRGIWTGKKHYILNVWDSEGVRNSEPELKIMGIEAVKSSTPGLCRDLIKKGLYIIMNGTENELIDFISKSRIEFYKSDINKIAFNKTANNIDKFKDPVKIYGKGTPIHIRGCLLHNYYLKKKNLINKYSVIQNGEKIKYCYLKRPNPLNENVISFLEFPSELKLKKFIDYDLQFEKGFLMPMISILNIIGWSYKKKSSLSLLFV